MALSNTQRADQADCTSEQSHEEPTSIVKQGRMQLNETPAWRRRLVRVVSMEAKGTSKEMELCSILIRQNLDKAAKPTGVCLPFSVVFEVEQWQVGNGVTITGLNYKQKNIFRF